jgi:hypothetical protein
LDKRLGVSQTVALYSAVLVLFRSLCSVAKKRRNEPRTYPKENASATYIVRRKIQMGSAMFG